MKKPGKLWLVCLILLSLLATSCLPAGMRLPESPALRFLERKSGLIAYVGQDGNLYTMDQGGNYKTALTKDARFGSGLDEKTRFYQFPAWSPYGNRLAYVGITTTIENIEQASIYTVQADGSGLTEVYHSSQLFPYYLYWSPDGHQISFMASSNNSNESILQVVPASGGPVKNLYSGSSIYWSWSPNDQELLLHSHNGSNSLIDTKLTVLGLESGSQEEFLNLRPKYFQTPAWSPAGDELLLAAETPDGKGALVLTDPRGTVKQQLASISSPVAFGWAPDAMRFAFLSNSDLSTRDASQKLTMMQPGHPEHTFQLPEEHVMGFFWSPNSQKLAYFARVDNAAQVQKTGGGFQLSLNIYDINRHSSKAIGVFLPTSQFINLLQMFDQYQQSATIWSPDSSHLLLPALDQNGSVGIFVVDASGDLQPRYIAPGVVAFWSWR